MSHIGAYIRARAIVQKAADLMDMDVMDITSDDRDPLMAEIRFAVMKVLRDEGYSWSLIGHMLLRDHSTVIHGVHKANKLMDNAYFSGFVEALR